MARLKGIAAVIEARADFRQMYHQMPQVLTVHPSRLEELKEAVKKMEQEAAHEVAADVPEFQKLTYGKIEGLLLGMKPQIDHSFQVTQGEVSLTPAQALEFSL